jgi:hypothetical protein
VVYLIFKMSVALHGKQAQEATVLIDTTVNACIEVEIMSTLNLYPALHLQVPVLVSFEYE